MQWLAIILTAMFAGAKLCGAISWPWWLVFAPAIVYLGWCLLALTIAGIVALIFFFKDHK